MIQNNKEQLLEKVYVSPAMGQLYFQSEGLLCVSAPGSSIDSATEEDWGTLI